MNIISIFLGNSVSAEDSFVGEEVHAVFAVVWCLSWILESRGDTVVVLSTLNGIMRQLLNIHYLQSLTRSHLAQQFEAASIVLVWKDLIEVKRVKTAEK